MDEPINGPTDIVSYKGATSRLKIGKVKDCQSNGITVNSTKTQIKSVWALLTPPPPPHLPSLIGLRLHGIKQGAAMDSLKFHPGPPCSTFLLPGGGPLLFYPLGHLTPYAYEFDLFFPKR
jgi:hypothetical protein